MSYYIIYHIISYYTQSQILHQLSKTRSSFCVFCFLFLIYELRHGLTRTGSKKRLLHRQKSPTVADEAFLVTASMCLDLQEPRFLVFVPAPCNKIRPPRDHPTKNHRYIILIFRKIEDGRFAHNSDRQANRPCNLKLVRDACSADSAATR